MKTKSKKTTSKKKKKKKRTTKRTQYKYCKQTIFIGKKVMIKIEMNNTHYKPNTTTYIYIILTTSLIVKLICI